MSAVVFDHKDFLPTVPIKPGVYRMLGEEEKVLYVGKARNLRNRVTSYFRASGQNAKTTALVGRIQKIELTVTASETEALLLEQSQIKSFRPPYNIVLRDDKSYPFIYLTDHKDYPRLTFHRGAKRKTGRYFGPFPSAGAVRDSLNVLQKLFHVRQCDDTFFKNRSRPCLQYQIQRCSGPCVNHISPEEYAEDVRRGVMFLEGRNSALLDEFKAQMNDAADALEFERAAGFRDRIHQLRRVQEQQNVHAADGDVDIFGVVIISGIVCVQGMFVRSGRLLGDRTWFPKNELDFQAPEMLGAFLSQFYLGEKRRDIPKTVITSTQLDDPQLLSAALALAVNRKVEVVTRVRGQRARWVTMAKENATVSIDAYLANKRNVYSRFVALQNALNFDDLPNRLECFDISHTSGEATVASCVVFDRNGPLKSDYRRFNIENIIPGDDYGAMKQALERRYTRLKNGEGVMPDLLIIDGGKGQMTQAREVLQDLQINDVQLLAIAKGPTRKPGLEILYLESVGEVNLPGHSGALHLVQHIRDEAHRFAITGHRQRRGKARRQSEIDQISGVGAKRKKSLLAHFGSLAGLKGAGVDEIRKVPGINKKLAEQIHASLHVE